MHLLMLVLHDWIVCEHAYLYAFLHALQYVCIQRSDNSLSPKSKLAKLDGMQAALHANKTCTHIQSDSESESESLTSLY